MNKNFLKIVLMSLSCVFLIVCSVMFGFILGWSNNMDTAESKELPSASVKDVVANTSSATPTLTPTATPEPITYTEMTLLSTGDLMAHMPQVNAARQDDGSYDFTPVTKYINEIVSSADYAVLNHETTILGEGYEITSYPSFNSPESILDMVTNAGFDMCLFANNHTYDKGHQGLISTQDFFEKHNLDYIGTRKDTESKSYKIVEVKGIKLGLLNYTYETGDEGASVKFLNGTRLDTRSVPLVDSFNYNRMESFYSEVERRIAEMNEQGADAIVIYLHWGEEYENNSNDTQKEIAQRLCNLGVDAIIGSHPHVVQESAMLTSDDGKNTTMCFYSTGNFISNQNRLTLSNDKNGYTENSVLYTLTFRKYSTGETVITKSEYTPTWVHRYHSGKQHYEIVPLELALKDGDSKSAYGLYNSSFGVSHAQTAFDYIDGLLKEGVAVFNSNVKLPYSDGEAVAADAA